MNTATTHSSSILQRLLAPIVKIRKNAQFKQYLKDARRETSTYSTVIDLRDSTLGRRKETFEALDAAVRRTKTAG